MRDIATGRTVALLFTKSGCGQCGQVAKTKLQQIYLLAVYDLATVEGLALWAQLGLGGPVPQLRVMRDSGIKEYVGLDAIRRHLLHLSEKGGD